MLLCQDAAEEKSYPGAVGVRKTRARRLAEDRFSLTLQKPEL